MEFGVSNFFLILLVVSQLVDFSFLGILVAAKPKINEVKFNEESEFVLTLSKSNFSETVRKHKFVVVEFYAPWCGYHKLLTPEYEKAASILSKEDPPIVLAKVDATKKKNKKLAFKYGISDINSLLQPALKILRKRGKVVQDYKGPRDADGIVTYLKKQVGPASVIIISEEEIKTVFNDGIVVVVGIFTNFGGDEFKNFITVAEKLQPEFQFAHTYNATLLPRGEPPSKTPIVRLFRPFDEPFVDFEDFHVNALEKFIREASAPLVTLLTKDSMSDPSVVKIFTSEDVKVKTLPLKPSRTCFLLVWWFGSVVLLLNLADKASKTYKAKYNEIAKTYKGKGVSFLIGDTQDNEGFVQFLGAKEENGPFLVLESSNKKYFKSNVAPEDITGWIKDFEEGKLVPFEDPAATPDTKDEL